MRREEEEARRGGVGGEASRYANSPNFVRMIVPRVQCIAFGFRDSYARHDYAESCTRRVVGAHRATRPRPRRRWFSL